MAGHQLDDFHYRDELKIEIMVRDAINLYYFQSENLELQYSVRFIAA